MQGYSICLAVLRLVGFGQEEENAEGLRLELVLQAILFPSGKALG